MESRVRPIHRSAQHTHTHTQCMGISMWIKGQQPYGHAILFLLCMQTQRAHVRDKQPIVGWIIAALQTAPVGQKRRCFQWCLDSVGFPSPCFVCKCVMWGADGDEPMRELFLTLQLQMTQCCWWGQSRNLQSHLLQLRLLPALILIIYLLFAVFRRVG